MEASKRPHIERLGSMPVYEVVDGDRRYGPMSLENAIEDRAKLEAAKARQALVIDVAATGADKGACPECGELYGNYHAEFCPRLEGGRR